MFFLSRSGAQEKRELEGGGLPVLGDSLEPARVAGAVVRGGDEPWWERHVHQVVDILDDQLVAMEEDNTLVESVSNLV